jgi:cytochrome c6
MRSFLLRLLLLCLACLTLMGQSAIALDSTPQLFEAQCAGCHAGGGNIVRRGKTLKLKALVKNHVDTEEAITELITQGKGNMSAYGDRLTPEEITALAQYVLNQAQQDWKS